MNGEKTVKELHDYRVKLFRDAQQFNRPERLPLNGNIWSWMFIDAGYTIEEAVKSSKKIQKSTEHMAKTYALDSLGGEGTRNATMISDTIGGSPQYVIKGNSVCVTDFACMDADDYDAFIADYMKSMYEIAFFKKYPKAKTMSAKELADAAKSATDFMNTIFADYGILTDKYGLAEIADCEWYLGFAFDELFDIYRGIKNLSVDIRRCPDKVKAFVDAVDGANFAAPLQAIKEKFDGPDMTRATDVFTSFLGHTILSTKQFEQYYWPYAKKLFDTVEEKGKSLILVAEGAWGRFSDYFNDYKKGTVAIFAEDDDIYEMRKLCPNTTLLGGLNVNLMGKGTPEECVAVTKKLYNELAGDGGLILSANKMVSYPNDMRSENLKAVADYNTTCKINY